MTILQNPLNFEYMLFRYLYAVKDLIEEDVFSEISNHKLKRYVKFMNELEPKFNLNQKMLFRDEMFSFNRFELSKLEFLKNATGKEQINLYGTLKDSIPPFFYPESTVNFLNVNILSILNGHKEKVSVASILRLPLILQGVQPSYDEQSQQHIVELYVSVDIYNPQFDEMIKIDALSNVCQIKFSYEDVLINLGLRHMSQNLFSQDN